MEATEEEKEELAKSKGRNKKKRSEKELKNFYRFQKREAKRGMERIVIGWLWFAFVWVDVLFRQARGATREVPAG